MTNEEVYSRYKLHETLRDRPLIEITQDDIDELSDFISKMIKAKMSEKEWQHDGSKATVRITNGALGEVAVEKLLKKKFRTNEIGHSMKFKPCDLKPIGLNCGVKTAKWENTTMVKKNPKSHEIMVILAEPSSKRRKCVKYVAIICGVASPEMQKKYSREDLIKTFNAKHKKNGYYRFDKLDRFNNLTELKKVVPKYG